MIVMGGMAGFRRMAGCLISALLISGSPSQARGAEHADKPYSPPVAERYPQHVYWGDLHLHTRLSADAYALGTQSISMEDAYRFARGEIIVTTTGQKARLRRPLDFLAVTDHAEYLGAYYDIATGNTSYDDNDLLQSEMGRRWEEILSRGEDIGLLGEFVKALTHQKSMKPLPREYQRVAWSKATETADRYNDPGSFSTLIGYEWTSQIEGNNLHRVVIYRDEASVASRVVPFSALDSRDPEDLWAALENYEDSTGGKVFAIPHNGNLSNGMMFAPRTLKGEPLTTDYAQRRSRWEPLFEVTQVKGDSETHPALSPNDEFADYERWDQFNIMMTADKAPWMLPTEYARSALGLGLKHGAELGVNPFEFGMVGGTDSHTGMSTTREDNFFGKFASSEPSPDRMAKSMAPTIDIPAHNWSLVASGLTAVWARENSREALFDALARREVYATTGTRITVRLFGGWGYEPEDVQRADYAAIGYAKGVPMGGELARAEQHRAPSFMVTAARDPDAANLDRTQIIKGWLDSKGAVQERIYDVALSGDREVDPETGKAPPVGSTVNVAAATYTNAIGDPELATVWTDPDFDPRRPAFYYARVIEIPTPRWTAYDAAFFGTTPPPDAPLTTTKRAYTSPIWYRPTTNGKSGTRAQQDEPNQ